MATLIGSSPGVVVTGGAAGRCGPNTKITSVIDSFSRTVTAGWGTATGGSGSWTVGRGGTFPGNAGFTVGGGTGHVQGVASHDSGAQLPLFPSSVAVNLSMLFVWGWSALANSPGLYFGVLDSGSFTAVTAVRPAAFVQYDFATVRWLLNAQTPNGGGTLAYSTTGFSLVRGHPYRLYFSWVPGSHTVYAKIADGATTVASVFGSGTSTPSWDRTYIRVVADSGTFATGEVDYEDDIPTP